MVVVADGLAVAHAENVLAHTAVGGALLILIPHTLQYETAGIAFVQVVADLGLSLQQDHLARSGEEVDVRVNTAELVQVVVGLAVRLVAGRALAECVDNGVTAHAGVTHHTHRDHLTAGLLDLLEELDVEGKERVPA